jgi:hypothetical protein
MAPALPIHLGSEAFRHARLLPIFRNTGYRIRCPTKTCPEIGQLDCSADDDGSRGFVIEYPITLNARYSTCALARATKCDQSGRK